MTPQTSLTIAEETTPITQILTLLKDTDHIWIVTNTITHTLTGIITRSNTLQLFARPIGTNDYDQPQPASLQWGTDLTAQDIMTPKPFTTTKDTTLADALTTMKDFDIKQLPITDKNDKTHQLTGELTLKHVIDLYTQKTPQDTIKITQTI
jgi:predicted transcriptional regulator